MGHELIIKGVGFTIKRHFEDIESLEDSILLVTSIFHGLGITYDLEKHNNTTIIDILVIVINERDFVKE